MFANERYDIICAMLRSKRSVAVSELCERFNVSIETVRRDLAYLEKCGKLIRVHGGAVAPADKNGVFGDLSERLDENVEKKRELAEYAVGLVEENDVIFIDAGSTAVEFTRTLCAKKNKLTIITYSTDIISIASEQPDFEVISLGGTYMPKERMFHGFMTEESMRMFHMDKCFIFPTSLSLHYGAMTNIPESLPVVRAAMKAADKTYLLADSTKFEVNAPLRICELAAAESVITDSSLDERICSLYRENAITIIKG
ncbi:MAG: DeoR/GlpR transcriptional regulator [Clostridia bacterium]|nr:DeoR/GlpR transcriptional regulator [Clostridia bacterium]